MGLLAEDDNAAEVTLGSCDSSVNQRFQPNLFYWSNTENSKFHFPGRELYQKQERPPRFV